MDIKKKIEWLVKILIYLTFFVPLVVIPSSFIFPFIVPKILLFRSLTLLMLAGYVALLLINWSDYKPRFTPLNVVMLVFVVSFAISTFVGVDPYHSFWDNHERMLGLFTILHYGAYYFICSAIFKNWTEWKTAFKIFLLAGSLVMLLGVIQKLDPNFLMNQGSGRVASTLGNAIYVGGYGLFLFFSSLLLFIREKDQMWKWFEIVGGLLALLGLFFSGTRGSLIGLFGGLVVLALGYSILLQGHFKAKKIIWGLLVAGVLILFVLYLNRSQSWVANIPTLGRLLSTNLSGDTLSTRFIAWNIAVEGWKERPIFGWGPNNFFYAFNKYYNPKSLESGYTETWFDNAHNILLNTLTVQGIFGFFCYLSIFIVAAVSLWRNQRLREKNLHVVVIGLAFLAAHLVQNVTVFENPTSYLYFIFLLAFINSLTRIFSENANQDAGHPTETKGTIDKKIGLPLLSIIFSLAVALIYIFNWQPARANMQTFSALNALYRDPMSGLAVAREVLNFSSPHIDDIRSDLSRAALQLLNSSYQRMGKEKSIEFLDVFYNNLQKNVSLHHLDIRNQISLASLSQLGWMISQDGKYVYEGKKYLEEAAVYSPRRQQILYMLSMFKLQVGETDSAIKLL